MKKSRMKAPSSGTHANHSPKQRMTFILFNHSEHSKACSYVSKEPGVYRQMNMQAPLGGLRN
jgi:hypothetical protein